MEEALDILWTYARRQAIDCNGKMVIPTINQSIAAIRLIIRLEEAKKSDERKSKSEEQKMMREEQKTMSEERRVKPSKNLELGYVGEEQSVMSVTDYTPSEEEEEEEVSPFAPFLLDEDDWSCSADNQLPKETPLSTIHYSLSTQKLPALVPAEKTSYHQQLKSCAKKYFEKYMKPKPFSNGKCQQTTSCKHPYAASNRLYDGFPTKKQHPTLHDPYMGVTQAELLSNVRPPPKSFKLAETNH
ncbi:hypothetical protein SAMN05444420_101636 [Capnocytophaga granulosa]|uniref:Uncharacterized protein n=1 Tax=Capnocytophaga granulosa TaxID=45242 RepID=A0A1H2S1M2_9FLAO|nr:hypothetical protein [Capnocytophaga granulosa]EPD30208.1 hypothetical protein HMPREF9331_00849 [Capnocytophaga granulosa ATCC 51502]SDW25546.1 hypothetical protein SAMN05444420_101636 [Capnocytophaga granulosa]SUX20328.1 Uncharacterised protein [Capnocytophaga granulosa]